MRDGCRRALRGFLRVKTQALIRFLAFTSWRLNEALSLRWGDIDFKRGCITYRQKGGEETIYPLDANLEAFIMDYRSHIDRWQEAARRKKLRSPSECAKHDYVFPARTGRKWHHAYDAIRSSGKAVGIRIYPHMLRRSFAQWAIDHGIDLLDLQMLMGHKDPATTQIYFRQDLKLKKRARNAIKFRL
jgi:integrase/recombinase XerD